MTVGSGDAGQCPACLAVLAGSPRFCPECGAPVAAKAARETRRTVTLLFTDVTGSTAMGEALDPEAYRSVMGRYFEVARAAVERHGGTIEKFVGDAVLAVFGVPEVREDDAIRAVRAADDLRSAMAELSGELEHTHDVRLAIRTGVNTGPVVTGSARAGGAFATGDAVNTAARLEQAAGAGEVLLGADTFQLVRDAVEVETAAPIAAKGKAEPVPAYRLVAVRHDDAGRTRRLDASLVGREHESRALHDALDRVLASGRGHLVTVIGAPGVGKTRLVSEFLDSIGDRAVVARGRCVSYGHGITFWPIVQAIRSAVGVGGGEPEEVTSKALSDAMMGAADGDAVVDLLRPLFGGAGVPGAQDQTFWAVRRILEQLMLRSPLVLTIDDLQWAEKTLLDLLDTIREELADLPLLLVCQARPELLDTHQDWGRGSLNALTFQLEPFGYADVRASIEGLLGAGVPDTIVDTIARWSGGNPLFVEEIVTHLRENGRLSRAPDGWRADDLDRIEMPPTVSALLAARLDRLPSAERDLLERVSVIGLEVTAREAQILAEPGTDVSAGLASLVRNDLLRRMRGVDHDSWTFRHILIRDAAYDSLPKTLRAELHEKFATALEVAPSDAGSEWLAFVAHHLEQAGHLRRELAPNDPRLAALDRRTAEVLAQAAEAARDRDELESFRTLLRRAVDLQIDNGLRRELLMRLADNFFGESAPIEEQRADLDDFEAALDATATALDHAFLANQRIQVLLSSSDPAVDVAEAERLARRLLELATAAEHRLATVQAHKSLAEVASFRSQWRTVLEHAEAVQRLGSPRDARNAYVTYGAAYLHGPFPFSTLLAYTEESLARPGNTYVMQAVLNLSRAVALAALDDPLWQEARDIGRQQLVDAGRGDDTLLVLSIAGEIAEAAGDAVETARIFAEMVDRTRATGEAGYAGTYQAFRACIELELGEPVEAVIPLLDEAEAWAEPYDVTSMTLLHTARAVVASRQGRHDDALRLAQQALAFADAGDALRHRADTRRWLAEVWGRAGDAAEQRRQLTTALREYREKEAYVLTKATERMLADAGGPLA